MGKRDSKRSRRIAEKKLGRPLARNKAGKCIEIVHHINGDPSDDRPENLAIVSRLQHAIIHHREHFPNRRPRVTRVRPAKPPWIKVWRDRRGYTQEDIAALAGVTATTIHRIESGKTKRPHPTTVSALIRALKVPMKDIDD